MTGIDGLVFRQVTEMTPGELAELTALYRSAGWIASGESGEFLSEAVRGSLFCAGAFCASTGRLIGFGRALSDGVSDAYLQDIVVDSEFRRRGVGGGIIRFLVDELRRRGVDWIGLVGEPGTEKFYAALGWKPQRNYTLWKWSGTGEDGSGNADRNQCGADAGAD